MTAVIHTDVLIIGCGAVGVALAREFAHYDIKVLVVDKNADVGGDATPACSSIAGAGYANEPGGLIYRLSHSSRIMYDTLLRELDIAYNPCGCIMPAFDDDQVQALKERLAIARKNGDYDVELLDGEEALEMEPELSPRVKKAIFSPREMLVDIFNLVFAQAENAAENGVEFLLNCRVIGMDVANGKLETVHTTKGDIRATWVINAAGLFSDEIERMAEGTIDFRVYPRKGQFFILDPNTNCKVSHILMPVPTPLTRGKLMLPTAHGNMLVGPTAENQNDKWDTKVTAEGLEDIERDIRIMVPNVNLHDAITQFSGLRPVREPDGYFIGFSKKTEGYFGISGVRSDGVGTSLGIAKYVAQLFEKRGIKWPRKSHYVRTRKAIPCFSAADDREKKRLIAQNPLYGKVICRCETVTEAEILEAIHRPVGACSVDGVKRRLRAGMGRCQGGFCAPKVMDILARELDIKEEDIWKGNAGSNMILPRQDAAKYTGYEAKEMRCQVKGR